MRLLLPLFISFLILSGCAHKRLLNAGDDFIAQGQYQRALEKYQRALAEQPNNKNTLVKLKQAQNLFNIWLDKVESSAIQAEESHHFAKAQLLYAKLAKHRNIQSYQQKQRDLRQNSLKHHGFKVQLSTRQPQLEQKFGQQLDHIAFIKDKKLSANNEIAMAFNLSKMNFSKQETSNLESKDYISHYQTIANPEYQHLQDDIIIQREAVKSLRVDVSGLQQLNNSQVNQLLLLEKDRQIALLTQDKTKTNSAEFYQLQTEVNDLTLSISQQQNINKQTDRKLAKGNKKVEKYEQQLDYLFQLLQKTPELAEEAVYAKYQYPVKTVQQLATAQLEMVINDNLNSTYQRQHQLQVEYSDKSHKGHAQIALKKNTLQLKSQAQLSEMLYRKSREKITKLILNELDKYQQSIIAQANNVADISSQLDQWLIAGLISKQGLPSRTKQKVEQQLRAEFGQGGYIKVNELLDGQ